MKITVAEAVAKIFRRYGIDRMFIFTGGDHALWISLKEHGIKMLLARSEQSAAYMADGYARATNRLAVTYGQTGPGATNLAAGLADAYWALSPVLAITSEIDDDSRYKFNYQGIEQLPAFASATKWNRRVIRPDRIVDQLNVAILNSMVIPRGPVHLDVPRDYFAKEIEADERWLQDDFDGFRDQRLMAEPSQVEKALDLISKSKKPLILAGGGCLASGAGAELVKVAEALQIPVMTSMAGKGIISEEHPLAVGVVGRYSRKVANDIASEADCVLVVGSRLGGLVTDTYKLPRQDAIIIRMDLSADTFNVTYKERMSIISDAKAGLSQIAEALSKRPTYTRHTSWAEETYQRVQRWRRYTEEAAIQQGERPLKPQAVMKVLNSVRENITVVADTGYMAAWAGALYIAKEPGSFFRAAGSLGWAFAASLGVQLAQPNRKVVCVIGDGGIGYHIGDIETALRLNIPVTVLVLNNSVLGFERHWEKLVLSKGIVPEVVNFRDLNYAEIAKSFGAKGIRVMTEAELELALQTAMGSDTITVVDIIVDKEEAAPVTSFDRVRERTV